MVDIAGVDFISRLPEGCISHVLSLTSPRDVSKAAMVSPAFHSSAASDTVWTTFLPFDIDDILSRAVDRIDYSSKMELYFRLCDSLLIDNCKMSFFLEKSSGKKCYMLSARQLSIIWGHTPECWAWISVPNSRFPEVAAVLEVCWLEIRGKLETKELSRYTKYAAYLVFNLTEGAQGFDYPSQETSVKLGPHLSSHITRLQTTTEPESSTSSSSSSSTSTSVYGSMGNGLGGHSHIHDLTKLKITSGISSRDDGWMEVELGEFGTGSGDDGEVEMSFMSVSGPPKSGLVVQGFEIRPKYHCT